MKKTILLTILLASFSAFGTEYNLGLRAGGGMGFSDLRQANEKHDDSHMIFGGLRPSITKGKWDLGLNIDFLKYTVNTDLATGPFQRAEHSNENVLFSLAPKYIVSDKFKIGPYIGRYLDKNILSQNTRSQSVVGIEADYNITKRLAVIFGLEHSTDSPSRHRMAKIGISFDLFPAKKQAKPAPRAIVPVCKTKTHTVYFGFDKHEISKADMDRLNAYLDGAEKGLMAGGHTDTQGPDEYNMKLSEKRLQSVMKVIEERGFKVDGNFYGEKNPVSDKHRNNRRVEIKDCQ